jgi:hypothetical protein
MKSSLPIPAAAPSAELALLLLVPVVELDDAVLFVAETVIANPP